MIASLQSKSDLLQYESLLQPFAMNLTHNKDQAEDLIQDTICRALCNQDKFSDGTNLKGWLYTIMRNIYINNYRRKQRYPVVLDTSDNQYLLNSTKRVEKNGSERSFMAEEINKAIEGVKEDYTKPFMMYFNGFKYEEIADTLDLPLGTIKSRIFSARKELQAKLKSMGITDSSAN